MLQKKPLPEHRDKLGRVINIGDFVAYPSHNSLGLGKVVKINSKMIGLIPAVSKRPVNSNTNKYPADLVRLEATDMTWYILKNSA